MTIAPSAQKSNCNRKRERAPAGAHFTLDGSEALELRLANICQEVLAGVRQIVSNDDLEGLVLGGGYGRGHGGVLRTHEGDLPYNDMEFYVFVRGNLLLAQRRYRAALEALGERLSPAAGLHVEFKIDSLEKLRASEITMYSYDLVAGHKIIFGNKRLFIGCEHHLAADQIPGSEATRLMFNRCSGLLLVRETLRASNIGPEESDFIGRNLAKAQLGFGDAVLTLFGHYHWNCRERHERLKKLRPFDPPSWLSELGRHHAEGVAFKLHPHRAANPKEKFEEQFAALHQLGLRVWLWIESRRLNHRFKSAREYALSDVAKCSGSASPIRNCLLNLRTYGPRTPFIDGIFRYPREQLFHALCLLLWHDGLEEEAATSRRLQNHLRSTTTARADLMRGYQRLWQTYG